MSESGLGPQKAYNPINSNVADKSHITRSPYQKPPFGLSKDSRGIENSAFDKSDRGSYLGLSDFDAGISVQDEPQYAAENFDDGDPYQMGDSTMGDPSQLHDHSLTLGSLMSNASNGLLANGKLNTLGSSLISATPRGVKRSRGGASLSSNSPRLLLIPSKQNQNSAISSIAKNFASRSGVASLRESDEFIVETERILQQETQGIEASEEYDQALHSGLTSIVDRLCRFWRSTCQRDCAKFAPRQVSVKNIGPNESDPPMHKATFLGALQLQLHHPPNAKGKQALAVARLNRSSTTSRPSPLEHAPPNPSAMPKVLVDWLDENHNNYGEVVLDVRKYYPNPTAHANFWDIIFSLTLRGKLNDVIQILQSSNFLHAKTSREDRSDDDDYSTLQIKNIERVINRAIHLLESCPSLQEGDWNVTGNDWILFRKRVEHELHDLATFSEGRDRSDDPTESSFEASNFGLRNTTMSLSQSARKAESRVPWTVYQSLKTTYGILLGGNSEILAMAQDWVEATIGLTIWWTGEDDEDVAVGSVALTRQSLLRSQTRGRRLVDVNANAAYLRRLANCFEFVTDVGSDDHRLPIDTLNPIEIGLASIFGGDFESVMSLLRSWSLPVASAVAEIAHGGGWFESAAGTVMNGLGESDLMVLSGPVQQNHALTQDAILMEYADALSKREHMRGTGEALIDEGWELSISVLTRLEDDSLGTKTIKDLLRRVPRDSDVRVDKILRICSKFNIVAEAREITEVS